MIQLEASSNCQLACPSCPTATGLARPAVGSGHLRFEDFQSILEKNPSLSEIELSNYGEIFLNPRLADMLRFAFERKVVTHADNGANLNFISEEALEALVKYRLRSITCSIDGASQETYEKYRVRGNFDKVISNIRRINEYKRQYKSGFPLLNWQFIIFGHNEHEIGAVRKLAGELGMAILFRFSWDDEFSPIRKPELVKIETRSPYISRDDKYEKTGVDYVRSICHQLWRAPVVNWDGKILGCCRNFWGDFGGNAFRDGLIEAVNNEKIQHAREMLMGRTGERDDLPCVTCDLYHKMKKDRTWLTDEELKPGLAKAPIVLSVFPETGQAEITHVDMFLSAGHTVDPILLVRPPKAARFTVGKDYSTCIGVPEPGDYTLYALPKRLDPTFRRVYPPIAPVTVPITVTERPLCQEMQITIGS
jgi:MoaA/NifB/PqqE/SkfB family radical SAM enzyme